MYGGICLTPNRNECTNEVRDPQTHSYVLQFTFLLSRKTTANPQLFHIQTYILYSIVNYIYLFYAFELVARTWPSIELDSHRLENENRRLGCQESSSELRNSWMSYVFPLVCRKFKVQYLHDLVSKVKSFSAAFFVCVPYHKSVFILSSLLIRIHFTL